MVENETFKKVLLKHGLEKVSLITKRNIHNIAVYINNEIQFRDNYELAVHQAIAIMERLGLLQL